MGMSKRINRIITGPLPRCFNGGVSCVHLRREGEGEHDLTIKLIKSDGGVEIYDRPVKARELMEEFPKHMVCRSDCFYIGQKTPALSHHDRLQPGHYYFLLPANFFQSALTFASFIRYRSALAIRPPFEVEKTASGSLRIKVTDEMIRHHLKEEETEARRLIRVCTTPQLRKEYEQLVGQRFHWKPTLDSISEKKKSIQQQQQHKSLRKTKSSLK
ncbi:uncharacterized protein LOC127245486 [Andrographis paniculata]|uniref:uncharacterized protein LOC127245486 n=1 Tax=Andrographis paniculata TaxID=175694 RepID=UPI0021E6FC9B|nr:uncharacterized protein LOC127245486 [Andrographis paniculata]